MKIQKKYVNGERYLQLTLYSYKPRIGASQRRAYFCFGACVNENDMYIRRTEQMEFRSW